MGSDFVRRTPLNPDKISTQALLEDIDKGWGYSFNVISMVLGNRK